MPSSSSSQKVKRGECSHPLWNVSKCFLFLFWASASVKAAVTLPKGDRIVQQGSRLMIQNTHKYTHTFAESRNTPTLIHRAWSLLVFHTSWHTCTLYRWAGQSDMKTHSIGMSSRRQQLHELNIHWQYAGTLESQCIYYFLMCKNGFLLKCL